MAGNAWPVLPVLAMVVANLAAWAANENSAAARWLARRRGGRQLPLRVWVSNRAAGIPQAARPATYWALDLVDPEHQVSSLCLGTPGLLLLHAATFLYWAVYVAVDLLYTYGALPNSEPDWRGPYGEWCSYFTNWSITLLGVAGLHAFANTLRRWRRERAARRLHSAFIAAAPQRSPSKARRARELLGGGGGGADGDGDGDGAASGAGGGGDGVGNGKAGGLQSADGGDQGAARDQQAMSPGGGASGRAHTATGAEPGSPPLPPPRPPPSAWDAHPLTRPRERWDWLSASHALTMETATAAAFCVALWYWVGVVGIAAGYDFSLDGASYIGHAGNVGVALLQVLLTRLVFVSYHFQILLWWGSLYLIFLWIFGAATGIWRYGLNVTDGRAAVATALLPIICFVTWYAWFLLARAREGWLRFAARLRQRLASHGGARGGRGAAAEAAAAAVAPTTAAARLGLPRADSLERAGERLPPAQSWHELA